MTIDALNSTILSAAFPTATSPTPTTAKPSVTQSVLAEEASVVATLGGDSGSSFQTYDATGLLSMVQQASQGTSGAPTTTATTSNTATPVSTLNGDWATILKSNPTMAGTTVTDAVAQGIVNTINVVA